GRDLRAPFAGGRGRRHVHRVLDGVRPRTGADVGGPGAAVPNPVRGDRRRRGARVRTAPLLYGRLTWPEVEALASEDRVCLVPVATLEDHGPHLPIDTDLRIVEEICRRAAEAAPEEIVLLPGIPHGYSPHHMD